MRVIRLGFIQQDGLLVSVLSPSRFDVFELDSSDSVLPQSATLSDSQFKGEESGFRIALWKTLSLNRSHFGRLQFIHQSF